MVAEMDQGTRAAYEVARERDVLAEQDERARQAAIVNDIKAQWRLENEYFPQFRRALEMADRRVHAALRHYFQQDVVEDEFRWAGVTGEMGKELGLHGRPAADSDDEDQPESIAAQRDTFDRRQYEMITAAEHQELEEDEVLPTLAP
jgi:hypothetical protein